MRIVSINRGIESTIDFNGEQVATGIFKRPVDGPVRFQSLGLENDTIVDSRVHGGPDQAIYIYHQEDYEQWSQELGKPIEFGTFGENLTVAGVAEIDWVIGDRLLIGEMELEISAPRVPCFKLAVRMGDSTFAKKFVKACRPGAYARVIKAGTLTVGDTITVRKTSEDYATVKEVFREWHHKNKSVAMLQKALNSPIAVNHKRAIAEWYAELS